MGGGGSGPEGSSHNSSLLAAGQGGAPTERSMVKGQTGLATLPEYLSKYLVEVGRSQKRASWGCYRGDQNPEKVLRSKNSDNYLKHASRDDHTR